MKKIRTVPVLIVGGGPVGLSMALALARQNIRSILVERNASTVQYPRTRGVSMRTMELFRQWGNREELLKSEQPKEAMRFIWAESLQGPEIIRNCVKDDHLSAHCTALASFVTQNHVEESLYLTLKNYPDTSIEFSKEMTSFEQDEKGVTATILNRENGQEELIHAKYLIAADGAYSRIRHQLGIAMEGPEDLGRFCSMYCELDLSTLTQHRPCVGFFFTDPKLAGGVLFIGDAPNRWVLFRKFEAHETQEDFTDAYCRSEIKRVINIDDIPVHIIHKSFWTMGAQVAKEYRHNRVFLVGDAAHRIPPTGGLGMNTGIQDAHNLAWKLAFVINHGVSDSLLSTYFEERSPVAARNIAWSAENAQHYGKIACAIKAGNLEELKNAIQGQQKSLNFEGLDLGYIYHSKAVISENEQPLSASASQYVPTTLPGSRAPHVPLIKEGRPISTLDLFEKTFVLLVGADGMPWLKSAQDLDKISPIPLKTYRIAKDGDVIDPENTWHIHYEISMSGAVLVRPDGHVAWRCYSMRDNPEELLAQVLRQLDLIKINNLICATT